MAAPSSSQADTAATAPSHMRSLWSVLSHRKRPILGATLLLVLAIVGAVVTVHLTTHSKGAGAGDHVGDKQHGAGAAAIAALADPPTSGATATATAPTAATAATPAASATPAGAEVRPDDRDSGALRTGVGTVTTVPAVGGAGVDIEEGDTRPMVQMGDTCIVYSGRQFASAVEGDEGPCRVVILKEDTYLVEREIHITRHVIIIGDEEGPNSFPFLDGRAGGAVRLFRVGPGGFLELRFLQVYPGVGIDRHRYGPLADVFPDSMVHTFIGGVVLFEAGCLGGTFFNVFFDQSDDDEESIEDTMMDNLQFNGFRVYGGDVLVMDGVVTFESCTFWDVELISPVTDSLTIGGNVLVLGGSIYMSDCFVNDLNIFGLAAGLGIDVAVLGGLAVFVNCLFTNQALIGGFSGLAQSVFVGGGVCILVGMQYSSTTGVTETNGAANFMVSAGVLVLVGTNIFNAFGLICATGFGFNVANTAGVMIHSGVDYVQFNGLIANMLVGQSVFMGAGVNQAVGVSSVQTSGAQYFSGQGGQLYVGSGISSWVGCPASSFAGIQSFDGTGGEFSSNSDMFVWIGSPSFSASGISSFFGLGGIGFVGAGGAVIGDSPTWGYAAIQYPDEIPDFWVQGSEYSVGIEYKFLPSSNRRSMEALLPDNTSSQVITAAGPSRPTNLYIYNMPAKPSVADLSNALMNNDKALSFVPREMVTASVALQQQMGDAAVSSSGSNKDHDLVWVQNGTSMDCSYCNIGDGIGGPGAATCSKEPLPCSGDQAVSSILGKSFDWTSVRFLPQEIIFAKLDVVMATDITLPPSTDSTTKTTTTAAVAPPAADVQKALQSFFNPGKEPNGVHASATVALSPGLVELLGTPDSFRDEPSSEQTYDLTLVASDATTGTNVSATLDKWRDDPQPLLDILNGYLSSQGGGGGVPIIASVDLTIPRRRLSIPPYNTTTLTKAFSSFSRGGSFSVSIADAAGSKATTLVRSHSYNITLSGFPPFVFLAVRLLGGPGSGRGGGGGLTISAAIATSAQGTAQVAFVVPPLQALGDGYYIEARDVIRLITGASAPLTVAAEVPARRLWGVFMRV